MLHSSSQQIIPPPVAVEVLLGLWNAFGSWENATDAASCSSVAGVGWSYGSPMCPSAAGAGDGWRGIVCDLEGRVTGM
jgi:hypothetical protein